MQAKNYLFIALINLVHLFSSPIYLHNYLFIFYLFIYLLIRLFIWFILADNLIHPW